MPSHINNFAELVQVLNLQKNNLPTYQVQVNGTGVDITEITNELNNLTAIASFADLADAYKRTIIGMKQQLYDGDVSEPVQAFPPNLTTPTLVLPLSGALTRARERNRRFKAAAGYTDAIGDALGIGPGSPPVILPDSLPTIDVSAAESGYLFSVVVSNRRQADQWELLARPFNGGDWTSMGSRTGKSSDFTYNPGPAAGDNPVQLQLRIQLKKNNENYGDPSKIAMATVNP